MRITITESWAAGGYTTAQVVEIDTSDRKTFKKMAPPETRELLRRSGSRARDDVETEPTEELAVDLSAAGMGER